MFFIYFIFFIYPSRFRFLLLLLFFLDTVDFTEYDPILWITKLWFSDTSYVEVIVIVFRSVCDFSYAVVYVVM